MCSMMKLTDCGQTMVEYTLLVVVVVSVMTSLFVKLEDSLINNPNSIQNRYLGQFSSVFGGQAQGGEASYRYFRIPK